MPMGFSVHPGPLPFFTIRDKAKWEPRLANGMIEILGENGCDLPLQMVRVAEVEDYDPAYHGPLPAHLQGIYAGRKLIAVWLDVCPKAGSIAASQEAGQ